MVILFSFSLDTVVVVLIVLLRALPQSPVAQVRQPPDDGYRCRFPICDASFILLSYHWNIWFNEKTIRYLP